MFESLISPRRLGRVARPRPHLPHYKPASTFGFVYATWPPTIVAATPPLKDQPWYGVFFDLLINFVRSIVTCRSGARMVRSAGAPGVSDPPGIRRIFAGFTDINSTILETSIKPVCTNLSSVIDT